MPVAYVCTHLSAWLLAACLVGSMSAGACLHVLWARYLRVDLDMVRALSAIARCSLLNQTFNFFSLSTFLQVIARRTAVSVDDTPGQLPGQLKALKHSPKDALKPLKHVQNDALNSLVGVHFSIIFPFSSKSDF